jgi:hypothetical protein
VRVVELVVGATIVIVHLALRAHYDRAPLALR